MMATPISSAMRWMVWPTLEPLQMMRREASFSMAHSWLSYRLVRMTMSPFSTLLSSISGVAVPILMWPVVQTAFSSPTTMVPPSVSRMFRKLVWLLARTPVSKTSMLAVAMSLTVMMPSRSFSALVMGRVSIFWSRMISHARRRLVAPGMPGISR